MASASIIVIGNEVLSGQIQDENILSFAKNLLNLSIKLEHVKIVNNNVENISNQVSLFSKKYDHVFIVSGLGWTLTMEGIASAFGDVLQFNQELYDILAKLEDTDANSSNDVNTLTKMSTIPSTAILHHHKLQKRAVCPVIELENVFIFPGTQSSIKIQFASIGYLLDERAATIIYRESVFVVTNEENICYFLNETIALFPLVTISSHPHENNLEISFTCSRESILKKAISSFMSKIPGYISIRKGAGIPRKSIELSHENFSNSHYRLHNSELRTTSFDTDVHAKFQIWSHVRSIILRNLPISKKIENSIDVIERAIREYDFRQLALSFNGGKDCTALLHLLTATFEKIQFERMHKLDEAFTTELHQHSFKSLYVMPADPFIEVENFVDESVQRYNLDLVRIHEPMKEALQKYLDLYSQVKAIFIGTRSTDPFADKLKEFSPSDNEWPEVMRIHPVLNWDYQDVWTFLRLANVKYMYLYDLGYTSIGGVNNTIPNPWLKNPAYICGYEPAFKLIDGSMERDGRRAKQQEEAAPSRKGDSL